jgi:hypothetical protein
MFRHLARERKHAQHLCILVPPADSIDSLLGTDALNSFYDYTIQFAWGLLTRNDIHTAHCRTEHIKALLEVETANRMPRYREQVE